MNIKIKSLNIEMTDAINDYTNKKLSEALNKFIGNQDPKNIFAEVELSKTNNHHNSGEMYQASVKVNGLHKDMFVSEVKDDLYASIDALKDKLEERVSELKDKKKTLRHKVALRFKNLFKRGE